MMRIIIFMTITMSLIACTDKKPKGKMIRYFVIGSTSRVTEDSTSVENIKADPADELLAQDDFTYNALQHTVRVYTSDNHAPVDGGRLYFTLDSLGIIYERSTTWPGFGRLVTNNDSVNDLINHTFAHILQNPELHCIQYGAVIISTPSLPSQ